MSLYILICHSPRLFTICTAGDAQVNLSGLVHKRDVHTADFNLTNLFLSSVYTYERCMCHKSNCAINIVVPLCQTTRLGYSPNLYLSFMISHAHSITRYKNLVTQ